jgi:hypothetical protein
MQKVSIHREWPLRHNNGKRETFFRSETVPKELMYTDFVYPEDVEKRRVANSEVAFDAVAGARRFDALEPMDPKLWNQELMRRDEWFKHWSTSGWRPPPAGRRAQRLHRALIRTAPSNKPDWDW